MLKKLYDIATLRVLSVTAQRRRLFIAALVTSVMMAYYRTEIIIALAAFPYVIEVFQLIAVTLFVYIVTSAVRMVMVSSYRNKHHLDAEDNDNFTIGASAIVGTLTGLAAFFWSFTVFDIEIYTFFTSIALFSVALATIFKDTIQDFIEGLLLLFTADYRVGDYVQVGSHPRGVIADITLAKTKLRLEDGALLFISNHSMRSNPVVNFSRAIHKQITVPFTIRTADKNAFATVTTSLCLYLENCLQDQIVPEKTSVRLADASAETMELLCEVTTVEFSFSVEKKIHHHVHMFAQDFNT